MLDNLRPAGEAPDAGAEQAGEAGGDQTAAPFSAADLDLVRKAL
jgi:hypothetical protein